MWACLSGAKPGNLEPSLGVRVWTSLFISFWSHFGEAFGALGSGFSAPRQNIMSHRLPQVCVCVCVSSGMRLYTSLAAGLHACPVLCLDFGIGGCLLYCDNVCVLDSVCTLICRNWAASVSHADHFWKHATGSSPSTFTGLPPTLACCHWRV